MHKFFLFGRVHHAIHPDTVINEDIKEPYWMEKDTMFTRLGFFVDIVPRRQGVFIPLITNMVNPKTHIYAKAFATLTQQ